jgi:hypothetical protein
VARRALLAALLAAYVATRFVALAPLTHPEPIDLLGVTTKLIEAGGLMLALRLLGTRRGVAQRCPPYTKELTDEQQRAQRTDAVEPGARRACRDRERRLWEDHITWTRLFIVSASADLPDTPATTQRLLRNQQDIGDAIKPFYGRAAGEQLTRC